MKGTWMFRILLALLGVLIFTVPAHATDHPYSLSLGLETPIGLTPQKASQNSPSFVWSAKMLAIEKVSVFTTGVFNLKAGIPFDTENKYAFGLERPIGYGLTLYSYWERRPDLDTNRYMVGCRWNFGGKL